MEENNQIELALPSPDESIFRRDHFTCQHCGRKAPEEELYVDYINQPQNGGEANPDNLITYCISCRGGRKYKISADDIRKTNFTITQQIEMLMKWRIEISEREDLLLEKASEYITKKIKSELSKHQKHTLFSYIRENAFQDILDSIDTAYQKDYKPDEPDFDFINSIGKYLFLLKLPPIEGRVYYVRAVCKNQKDFCERDLPQCQKYLDEYVKALSDLSYSEQDILSKLFELERFAKNKNNSWMDIKQHILNLLKKAKGEYNKSVSQEDDCSNTNKQSKEQAP